MKHGTWTNYYPGGVVPTIVSQYRYGRLHGVFKQYDRYGRIVYEIHYKHGLKDGPFYAFKAIGQLITKKLFKNKWFEIAQALEFFDIIEKCICYNEVQETYCDVCKGARYKLSSYLNSDEIREIGIFFNAAQNADLAGKLQKGLMKALDELS